MPCLFATDPDPAPPSSTMARGTKRRASSAFTETITPPNYASVSTDQAGAKPSRAALPDSPDMMCDAPQRMDSTKDNAVTKPGAQQAGGLSPTGLRVSVSITPREARRRSNRVQTPAQIAARTLAVISSDPPKKRGWPLGKKRGPRQPKAETANTVSQAANIGGRLSDDSRPYKRRKLAEDARTALSPVHSGLRGALPLLDLPQMLSNTFVKPVVQEAANVQADETNERSMMAPLLLNLSQLLANTFQKTATTSDSSGPTDNAANDPRTPRKASRRTTAQMSPHFHHEETAKTSEHFRSPKKRAGVSAVRFPTLKAESFGLIQEELASEPFRILVATMFLTKTAGLTAAPTLRRFLNDYPTPESLAAATTEDLFPDIQHLGLANNRSKALIEMAKAYVAWPPEKGKRYRKLGYPEKGSGKDIQVREEPIADDDSDFRLAYEVAHLPGIGPYGLDSWRIFCRDNLRGKPSGIRKESLKGDKEAIAIELGQEWARMRPLDKELRAYIKWRWLRLGQDWDPETGVRKEIDRKVLKKMETGAVDEHDGFLSPWGTQLRNFLK